MNFQKNGRFRLVTVFAVISLLAFIGLRFWFMAISGSEIYQEPILVTLSTLLAGLLYDAAFILYLCIPVVLILLFIPARTIARPWVQYTLLAGYYALLCVLFFTITAEIIFWQEFSVRFNFISVDYLVYRREVTQNIYESYPVFLIFSGIFFAAALVFAYTYKALLRSLAVVDNFRWRAIRATTWIACSIIVGYALNQQLRETYNNNYLKEIASNGPYQFFAAFRNNELDYETFYLSSDNTTVSGEIRHLVERENSEFLTNELFDIRRKIDNPGVEKRLNVILVSVESLSASYLKRYGQKKVLTPFMDDWMRESIVFDKTYATGTRTTRGLEAITLSIPPTPGRSVVKRIDNNRMYSLGKVFKDRDYDVAFLYGGHGYFDNMNAFFSGNGYRIVDQNDFDDDEIEFSNAWGVNDESLYKKAIKQADIDHKNNQPFFFHLMTVSNHRPYTYPEGKIEIASGEGRDGAVRYSDYALQTFIEEAKHKPWFDNTVFVVLADHTAGSAGKVGLPIAKYHIPFLIYSPKHFKPQTVDKVVSQIDLAPTLLGLLNFDYTSNFYGENILSPDFRSRALIGNYQKLGLYEDDELVILSPQKQITQISKPYSASTLKNITIDESPVGERVIGYYQSASYILEHHLNRW